MTVQIPDWLEIFCIYYFVSVCLVYAILRLNEPVVLATFKRDLTRCCRRREMADDTEAGS